MFTTTGNAGWINISSWTYETANSNAGCVAGGVLPYKDTCTDSLGIGSQLTVR